MNAAYFVPLVGIMLMVLGLVGVAIAAWRSHRTTQRLDFIRSLGSEAELYADAVPVVERVQEPLVSRILGPTVNGLRHTLSRLYPAERHRPGARRPVEGRPDRIGTRRGVRRHPGGPGHGRHRHGAHRVW